MRLLVKKTYIIVLFILFYVNKHNTKAGENFFEPFTEPLKFIKLSTDEKLTPVPLIKKFLNNSINHETEKISLKFPFLIPDTQTEQVYLDFKLKQKLNMDAENVLKQAFNLAPNLGYWFDNKTSLKEGAPAGLSIPSFYGGKVVLFKDLEDLLTALPYAPEKPPFVMKMEDFIPVMKTGYGTFNISLNGLFPIMDVDFNPIEDVNIPLEEIFPTSVEPLKIPSTIDWIHIDSPDSLLNVLNNAVFLVIP